MECIVCSKIFSLYGAILGYWGKFCGPICNECYDKETNSLKNDKWLTIFQKKLIKYEKKSLKDCEKVLCTVVDCTHEYHELQISNSQIISALNNLLSHIDVNKRRAEIYVYLHYLIALEKYMVSTDLDQSKKIIDQLKGLLGKY